MEHGIRLVSRASFRKEPLIAIPAKPGSGIHATPSCRTFQLFRLFPDFCGREIPATIES